MSTVISVQRGNPRPDGVLLGGEVFRRLCLK
jgi:hypothetical protein